MRALRRVLPLIAMLAALCLVAAACGSTAKKTAVSGDASGDAEPQAAGPDSATEGGRAGAEASADSGAAVGTGAGSTRASASGAPVSGIDTSRRIKVAPNVPGVTDKFVYVGAAYTKNQGAGNAAVGAGGLDAGDARQPYNVVIDDINKHGGLAGRKIKPIYYGYDATSTQTADEQDEAACATWTQDNKVFVIFASGEITDECARKQGAMEFGSRGLPETYKKYPHRIDITGLNIIRLSYRPIEGLFKQKYFEKGAKIGLVTWDTPVYRSAVARGYVPALRSHGLKLGVDTAYIQPPQTLQEVGATSASVNSAVLRFKTANVTHVMILDGQAGVCGGSCIVLLWMKQSDAQRYYPRYGFNDTNSAKEAYELKFFSAEQARRSIYVTSLAVNDSYDEGWKPNASRKRCEALMKSKGIDMSDPNAHGAAVNACENLWFLQLGVQRLTGALSADAFVDTIERLGYSYTSPFAWYNFFSAQRHDGQAGERIMAFMDSCDCFKFVTKPYKI